MTDTRSSETSLPPLALSVRQPWAWAIIFGGKTIENRSLGSIRAGRMVTEIISKSDNPWFGGDHGLVLADPSPVEPIPSAGALGYFEWTRSGECAAPLPWMLSYGVPGGDNATLDLFPDAPQAFRDAPKGPGGRR